MFGSHDVMVALPLLLAAALGCGLTGALAARAPCRCPLELQPNVCGSDGNTYPSRCDLDCARMTTPGLTLWRDGPCGYVPVDQAAAAGSGLRLEELSGCLMRCMFEYDACRHASCRYGGYDEKDAECLEGCARNMTACTCGCKQPAAGQPTTAATTTTASPRPDVRWNARQMLRRWREGDDGRGLTRAAGGGTAGAAALRMYQCVEDSGEALAKCMWDCGADNACVVSCSHSGLDAMCRCSSGAGSPPSGPALAVRAAVVTTMVAWLASWAKAA